MDFELSEELKMIQSLAHDFVDEQLKPLERDILGRSADLSDARAFLPAEKEAELIEKVRDMGLWGIGVPEEFGGVGLSVLGVCLVEEELARTIIPFHFGDVTPVLFDCNAQQRVKYLLPALNYKKRVYLALMEPDGSVDFSSMKTSAEKTDGYYMLNGKKLSLSRDGEDYFAVVFAAAGKGVTCFLVDKGTPGFSVAGGGEKIGWLSQVREILSLVFDGCRIRQENILGEEGKAFSLGKKWLPHRRIIRGARCVGAARRLFDEAALQAKSLETFGKPIFQRANIQDALAEISAQIHAARLMVYEAASLADCGKQVKQQSAMVKLYTTQMLHTVADRVAHVFNGPPFMARLSMERLCRRALEISAAGLAMKSQSGIIAQDILKS